MLTPAGALSIGGGCWMPCPSEKLLFSVWALSEKFGERFCRLLKRRFRVGKLTLRGRCAPLGDAEVFSDFLELLSLKEWVVFSKPSFAGPEKVLEYLGRYTQRIAISNGRIVDVCDGGAWGHAYEQDSSLGKVQNVGATPPPT